jgi:hypothetical protein
MARVVGGEQECGRQDKAIRRVLANHSRKLGDRKDTRQHRPRTTALTGVVRLVRPRGGFR